MDAERIIEIASREIAEARAFFGPDVNVQTALLPALHSIQAEYGCVEQAAIPLLASEFNLSQAEIRGVISFYHDFRVEKAGRRVLKLCRAEACQSMGGEAIARRAQERHHLPPHATSAGGALTIENVYCLGNCALAPAAMLDDEVIGRMTGERLDAIISGAR